MNVLSYLKEKKMGLASLIQKFRLPSASHGDESVPVVAEEMEVSRDDQSDFVPRKNQRVTPFTRKQARLFGGEEAQRLIALFADFSNERIRALLDSGDLHGVLRGTHEARLVRAVIHLDSSVQVGPNLKYEPYRGNNAIEIELRADGTYVDGRKMLLVDRFHGGTISSKIRNLVTEARSRTGVVSSRLLDFLTQNPHFWPEEWRNGKILFLGDILKDVHGTEYVRYGFWKDRKVHSNPDCVVRLDDWGIFEVASLELRYSRLR